MVALSFKDIFSTNGRTAIACYLIKTWRQGIKLLDESQGQKYFDPSLQENDC